MAASEVPDARLELRQVDLSSLTSVRAFAAGWDHGRLDLLIDNAGVAMVPYALTTDGYESQFGINHLGTFALKRLADAAGLKLRSIAVAPGLTRTNVLTGGANSRRGRLYATITRLLVRVAFRPTPEGAKTSLYAASTPDLPGGSYIVPDGLPQLRGEPTRRTHERAIRDTDTAARLWQLSEHLTGVTYELSAATATRQP